ncbi:MAG: sn-glycerol-3-phosphate ABC transporter ATP-binding protein UgpC [Hyphomicrobiales bacterium]
MAEVLIQNLHKSYGPVDVLKDINLKVQDGSFVVLVGPSGCGKSTLLRSIAGLEPVTSGTIAIGGSNVGNLAPAKRGIAMVFQSYALYPHMDVEKNMAFGLRFAGTPKDEITARVAEAARILKLEPLLKRKPRELSGGQRQRVAIGRAIVRKPQVFLFDEPLSNLDAALRVNTRVEIARLHKLLKATIIYVTHDQVEAMTLADTIVVMNQGRIEQAGKPLDLYYKPANLFVARFIGSPAMNIVEGVTADGKTAALGNLSIPLPSPGPVGSTIAIGFRPEHCGFTAKGLAATVELVERLGEVGYVHCSTAAGQTLLVEVKGDPKLDVGAKVHIAPTAAHVHIFDAEGQRL